MILPTLVTQRGGDELPKLLSQLELHQAKTKLLINPKEADHQALVGKMEDIALHVLSFKGQPNELTAELTSLAQAVLKREWEQVKAFK